MNILTQAATKLLTGGCQLGEAVLAVKIYIPGRQRNVDQAKLLIRLPIRLIVKHLLRLPRQLLSLCNGPALATLLTRQFRIRKSSFHGNGLALGVQLGGAVLRSQRRAEGRRVMWVASVSSLPGLGGVPGTSVLCLQKPWQVFSCFSSKRGLGAQTARLLMLIEMVLYIVEGLMTTTRGADPNILRKDSNEWCPVGCFGQLGEVVRSHAKMAEHEGLAMALQEPSALPLRTKTKLLLASLTDTGFPGSCWRGRGPFAPSRDCMDGKLNNASNTPSPSCSSPDCLCSFVRVFACQI